MLEEDVTLECSITLTATILPLATLMIKRYGTVSDTFHRETSWGCSDQKRLKRSPSSYSIRADDPERMRGGHKPMTPHTCSSITRPLRCYSRLAIWPPWKSPVDGRGTRVGDTALWRVVDHAEWERGKLCDSSPWWRRCRPGNLRITHHPHPLQAISEYWWQRPCVKRGWVPRSAIYSMH